MRWANVTIEDVARAAGVSRSTAHRALNGMPNVSESCRRRVLEAAKALGYRANVYAQALAYGKPSVVDLIAVSARPDASVDLRLHNSRVLDGVDSVLRAEGITRRLHLIGEDVAAERIDVIAGEVTKGAILINVAPDLALRFYRRCGKVISLTPTAPEVPAVETDDAAGAFNAVAHLRALGCRQIAAIHGPALDPRALNRRTGYRWTVKTLGLSDIGADGGFTREGGYAAAVRLLDEHPGIDAIFAGCDLMAAGAIQAIIATGRRVPHDISVIGFDDSLVAILGSPMLTTMRQPVEDMAAAATRMLLDGGPAAGHRERFFVELVERDSTIRASPCRTLAVVRPPDVRPARAETSPGVDHRAARDLRSKRAA